MLRLLDLVALLSLSHLGAGAAVPSPIDLIERQTAGCSAYTIINTRGTTEPQAESSGFITMNKAIRAALPSGETYNTVYPADSSQTSQVGTEDIIAHITSVLSTDPDHCFVLEGYSQGAKSTVQAMPSLTGASFDAVKAVFLIGNPYHKAGLACNVDLEGGESTLNVDGKSLTADNAIPDSWVSKTLDVCNKGDGVCDTTNGQKEITDEHTAYQGNTKMQNLGADFVIKALNAATTAAPSPSASEESASASTSASEVETTAVASSTTAETTASPATSSSESASIIASASDSSSSSVSESSSVSTSTSEVAGTGSAVAISAGADESATSSEATSVESSSASTSITAAVDPSSTPASAPDVSNQSGSGRPSGRPTRTRCHRPKPTQAK